MVVNSESPNAAGQVDGPTTYQVELPADVRKRGAGHLQVQNVRRTQRRHGQGQTFGAKVVREELGEINKTDRVDAAAVEGDEKVKGKHRGAERVLVGASSRKIRHEGGLKDETTAAAAGGDQQHWTSAYAIHHPGAEDGSRNGDCPSQHLSTWWTDSEDTYR